MDTSVAFRLIALIVAIACATPLVGASTPQYSVGDIVYTGSGDRFVHVSNNLVMITGISEDCRSLPCRPMYYRFERGRLVPYPSEWNAPGGYVYADPVFSMGIQEFEERFPVFIQHSDLIREHSFKVLPGVLPW